MKKFNSEKTKTENKKAETTTNKTTQTITATKVDVKPTTKKEKDPTFQLPIEGELQKEYAKATIGSSCTGNTVR